MVGYQPPENPEERIVGMAGKISFFSSEATSCKGKLKAATDSSHCKIFYFFKFFKSIR
jgi:hypothetical protein